MPSNDKPTKPSREDVEGVEAAAQRSVCVFPDGNVPDDLVKALERRVEINLELATSATPARLAGNHVDVRLLEAPYRKRVARTDADLVPTTPQPTQPRDSRVAKKSATPKAATNPKGSD